MFVFVNTVVPLLFPKTFMGNYCSYSLHITVTNTSYKKKEKKNQKTKQ